MSQRCAEDCATLHTVRWQPRSQLCLLSARAQPSSRIYLPRLDLCSTCYFSSACGLFFLDQLLDIVQRRCSVGEKLTHQYLNFGEVERWGYGRWCYVLWLCNLGGWRD